MAISHTDKQHSRFKLWASISIRIIVAIIIGMMLILIYAIVSDKQIHEAEKSALTGGAAVIADQTASEGKIVAMAKPGDGINFTKLPKTEKLAIRYASVHSGTISVQVDHETLVKVNVHSTGVPFGTFIYAIIDVPIPRNAILSIALDDTDVAVSIDQILVGKAVKDLKPDIWNLPELPIADGPYNADWEAISRLYTVPAWWREAKFGAWSHWDPQSMPEKGDWYARGMYMEGHWQYEHHRKTYGHPSEYGYKDICRNWVIDQWNPEELMDLYIDMGARYFLAMGVHHDNFDCWNSAYQPWNSVNVGPKVDIVGTWEKIARQHGMRFGIGFHNTPARTWGQFMTVRYTNDKKGDMKGVPYDALQTIVDGKGRWWEGMDPVDLYGPVHDIRNPLNSPFANQFMWRIDDAITKYHPDLIYFDEHAGDSQIDLGVQMGLGFLAPRLIANYYNKSLEWNKGKMDVVLNLKGVGGRYNSFQNSPELLPYVDRALVKSSEFVIEPEIMAYPFQTETSITDWHYKTGQVYMDAATVVRLLLENVSRNGTLLLNLTQHGRGDLDPELVQLAKEVGVWLKVNGEAIYDSRPFEVLGEDSVFYTRNNGHVYACILNWDNGPVFLEKLRSGGRTIGKVHKVELLGSDINMKFIQDENGLTVRPEQSIQSIDKIENPLLSDKYRVLRITHDKDWFNDDDPGISAPGWSRQCNLDSGDYNNDLTTSDTPGSVWSYTFTGSYLAVLAPKDIGAGELEVLIDGKSRARVDLSTSGRRKPQQWVFEEANLSTGKHLLDIIHSDKGKVAIDALIIK